MPGASNYFCRASLRFWFRATALTPPATIYAALFPGDPGADGTSATEISGNAYARVAITFQDVPNTGAPGPMACNAATFPTCTPNPWGTITHVALFDALTAGNILGSAALTTSKVVGAGDTIRVPGNNLTAAIS